MEKYIDKKCEIYTNLEEMIEKEDALQKKINELKKKTLKNQAKSNFLKNRSPFNLTKKDYQTYLCSYGDLLNDKKQSFFNNLFLFFMIFLFRYEF